MSVVASSPTPAINVNTDKGSDLLEHNERVNKDNKDTTEEDVEEGKREDLLEIAGARGRWTQRIFFLCASS